MSTTAEWYYLRDGQQVGPVASSQLKQLASRGQLREQDLVWRDGLTNWVAAARIKGLFPDEQYTLLEDEAPPAAPSRSGDPSTDHDDEFLAEAKRPRKAPRHGYASFGKRWAAMVIDNILILILAVVMGLGFGILLGIAIAAGVVPRPEDRTVEVLGQILGVVISWLYFAQQECSERQATFGKRMMKIKVTDETGRRISFGRATGRFFAKYLSIITLMIGFIMAAFTERKQALHDKLAHTLVIND